MERMTRKDAWRANGRSELQPAHEIRPPKAEEWDAAFDGSNATGTLDFKPRLNGSDHFTQSFDTERETFLESQLLIDFHVTKSWASADDAWQAQLVPQGQLVGIQEEEGIIAFLYLSVQMQYWADQRNGSLPNACD